MSNCTKPLVSDLIDKAYNVSFHLGGHILFFGSFSFGLF